LIANFDDETLNEQEGRKKKRQNHKGVGSEEKKQTHMKRMQNKKEQIN
jgi:hypothetical protein